MNTGTLDLGRRTPRTRRERAEARAGIEACNADWRAGALTTSDDMIRAGWSRVRRAGYQLRWHELAAACLVTREDVADLARWEGEGGA